jgi:hypothetical protein
LFAYPLLLGGVLLSACSPLAAPEIVAVTPLAEASVIAPATATLAATTAAVNATPTPLAVELPQGSAAAIALATDVAMQPEVANPIQFAESPVPITFDEFYSGFNMRTGLTLSDKLLSLDGQTVVIEGYMAPPLKPELDWFVLTRIRLEFCPFCSSTADWPDDIALVYLLDEPIRTTIQPLRIQGRMEIGSAVDPETGMVSLVRIYAEQVEPLTIGPAPVFASQRTYLP